MNRTWLIVLIIVLVVLGVLWYTNRDAAMDEVPQEATEETMETTGGDEATGDMGGEGSIEIDTSVDAQ